MVKLGHLVVFDEEQVAKCCIEAVQPDLCLLEEKQEGSVAIFSLRGWQKSRLGWSEESQRVHGPEELLVMLKSYRRVGRREPFLPVFFL